MSDKKTFYEQREFWIVGKFCIVCGYEMDKGPFGYNICPCCGTEFDLHDFNVFSGDYSEVLQTLMHEWIDRGKKWSSTVIPQPIDFDPDTQVARLLIKHIEKQFRSVKL